MTYTKKLAVAGAALVASLVIPVAAGAQTTTTACSNRDAYARVCGREVTRQQLQQRPKVLGTESETVTESVSESSTSDTLPVTGGDLVGLTALGLGAVAVGSVFVRRSRRTT